MYPFALNPAAHIGAACRRLRHLDAVKKLPWHHEGTVTPTWCLQMPYLGIWLGPLNHAAMPVERQQQLKLFFRDAQKAYGEAYQAMQTGYQELKRTTYQFLVKCAEQSAYLETLEQEIRPLLHSGTFASQFQALVVQGRELFALAQNIALDLVREFHEEVALDGLAHNDQGDVMENIHFVLLPITTPGKKEHLYAAMFHLAQWTHEMSRL